VNEDLLHEMRSVKVILQEIVDDLGYYFFDHNAIARLHTERILNTIFDDECGNKTYTARLAINASHMNEMDDTGRFANFVMGVMKEWLARRQYVASAVQSAEHTTYQLIVDKPEDLEKVFSNFKLNFSNALRREFAARFPDMAKLSDDEKRLLECIDRFEIRGTAVVMPLHSGNILDMAIQTPEDIKTFRDILYLTDLDIEAMKRVEAQGSNGNGFASFKALLKDTKVDFPALKRWVGDGSLPASRQRSKILQAFVLQGSYYHLARLSGVLEYFEKERAPLSDVDVYLPSDVDGVLADQSRSRVLESYMDIGKYVSDGTYDPSPNFAHLDERFFRHLPHLEVLFGALQIFGYNTADGIAKILNIWQRISREWGYLTHLPREDNPGGAKEILFSAIDSLDEAYASGDRAKVYHSLEKLKKTADDFGSIAAVLWAKSMADPKNPFFLKRDDYVKTRKGEMVNANVFIQELFKLNWRSGFAAEADSIQQFLRHHRKLYAPDFSDAAFQSVWNTAIDVTTDWKMPVSIMSKKAGDFVMHFASPYDVDGMSIDPYALAHEVWSRVKNNYAVMKYPDLKKVALLEFEFELDSDCDIKKMNLILKEVADEMGLQAVPFVVNGGDRRCILYIPEMISVGSEEYTDALSVLNSLKSKGASFSKLRPTGKKSIRRMGIYESSSHPGSYRFSEFDLGHGWKRFQKTLTLSVVLAMLDEITGIDAVEKYSKLQDELSLLTELEKRKKFPHKAGFSTHPSMKFDSQNFMSFLEEQWRYFADLFRFFSSGVINHINEFLNRKMPTDPVDVFEYNSFLSKMISSYWLPEIARGIQMLSASNDAMRMLAADSGIDKDESLAPHMDELVLGRTKAIRSLGEINELLHRMNSLTTLTHEKISTEDAREVEDEWRAMRTRVNEFCEWQRYVGGNVAAQNFQQALMPGHAYIGGAGFVGSGIPSAGTLFSRGLMLMGIPLH